MTKEQLIKYAFKYHLINYKQFKNVIITTNKFNLKTVSNFDCFIQRRSKVIKNKQIGQFINKIR